MRRPSAVMRCLVVLLTLGFTLSICMETTSYAQVRSDTKRVRTTKKKDDSSGFFLFRLLGIGSSQKKKAPPKKVRRKRTPRSASGPTLVRAPQLDEKPKNEDAKVLLVVGDELAQGVAEGLKAVYAKIPSIRVKKIVHSRQGLGVEKNPTWADEVSAAVKGKDVGLVVVTMGALDYKPMKSSDVTYNFQSPDWLRNYRFNVASLTAAVRNEQLPLIWVGLAPAKSQDISSGYSYLNDLFKEQVEPSGGLFVDIWQAFLDENGEYTAYGPDVSGKKQKLRSNDGIYFTWAGYRKIAYFVEREIARVFGSASAFIFEGVKDNRDFIVLTGRLSSPETKLIANEGAQSLLEVGSPQYNLIIEGKGAREVSGRADETYFAVQ